MTMLVAVITLAEAAGSALAARCAGAGIGGQATLAALGAALIGAALLHPPGFSLGRRRAVLSRGGRHSAAGRRGFSG